MGCKEAAGEDEKHLRIVTNHAVKRRVEIVGRTFELRRVKLQTQRLRRALCCRECFRRACIPENGQSCPCWEGFREQLDAFLRQFRLPVEHSRDTTAGPRQARYVAARDRVIIVGEDDDWNAGARRDCGLQRQFGAARHNDRYVRARHRSRIGESLVRTLVGAAIVDDEVAAIGEPELLQFGDKGPISQSTRDGVVEPGVEHADTGDLRGALLHARRKRPRDCRAAEQRYEGASPHWAPLLTLSAAYYHAVAEERRGASQQKLR